MWPWIKRWQDWAMNNLWPITRISHRPQALHFSFEKAGLTLHDQAIPWNAEAVQVEVLLLPSPHRSKADFKLRLGAQFFPAEGLRREEGSNQQRLFFRVPTPTQTVSAEVLWRNTSLGQLTLPVLGQEEFLTNLRVQLPTLFARIGKQSVACQTFVSSQCKGLMASIVLTSPTSLVPLLDMGLQVEFRSERTGAVVNIPAPLTSSQLTGKQALVTVVPPKLPRRIDTWSATWK